MDFFLKNKNVEFIAFYCEKSITLNLKNFDESTMLYEKSVWK